MAKSILSVDIIHEPDNDPDLSYLGEYTDQYQDGAIYRNEDDRYGRYARRGEYRYFVPAMTGEESGNPDSPRLDYERAEAYNRGEWGMLGVYAKADILVNGIRQTVRTGGIWGVESDSGESHFEELGKEQLADLRGLLAELGFSKKAVEKAFREIVTNSV